jgi:hypothetical protein
LEELPKRNNREGERGLEGTWMGQKHRTYVQIVASSDVDKMVTKHGRMTGNHNLLGKLLQYNKI